MMNMNHALLKNKNKFVVAVLSLFSLILLLTGILFLYFQIHLPQAILIPDVPYFGIYNTDWISTSNAAAGVYSILQYWRQFDPALPDPPLSSIKAEFPVGESALYDDVLGYFQELGYVTKTVRARDLRSIFRLLQEEQAPLLFAQKLTPGYSGRYSPYRVLIGVNVRQGALVVHDMYFGPAYALPFDQFLASYPADWEEGFKYTFLIAKPKHYQQLIAQKPDQQAVYPDRALYERFKNIVVNWLEAANVDAPSDQFRIEHYQAIISDPAFAELSLAIRVVVHNNVAASANRLGQHNDARQHAQQAIVLNQNLDQPFGIWSGIALEQWPHPWKHLGDAYVGLGQRERAAEAYRQALAIDPGFNPAREVLERLQME